MKESRKKKVLPMMGVLLAVIGSFAALLYLSVSKLPDRRFLARTDSFSRFQGDESHARSARAPRVRVGPPSSAVPGWSKTVLHLGRERKVGQTILTYRGLDKRSKIKIDAIIPALDPSYSYPRRIDFETAKKGFQVGAERFVLISAGKSTLRLKHHGPRY